MRYHTAGGRGRTGTGITTHGILSPGRLPIPPRRRIQNITIIHTHIFLCKYFLKEMLTKALSKQEAYRLLCKNVV